MQEQKTSSGPINNLELLGSGTTFQDRLCDMVANVPLFDNLSGPDLRLLSSYLQAYRAPANATIVEEGSKGEYLGIILEGKVIVYKEDGTGARKQLTVITPGKSFGEMSLIDELPHSAAIVAETETVLVLLSRENFRKLVENHAVIGVRLLHKISRLLSLRLRQTSGQLVEYLG